MMESIQKFTAMKHKKRNLLETSDDEHIEKVKKALLKDKTSEATKLEVDRLFYNVSKPIELPKIHPFYPPPRDFIFNSSGAASQRGSREHQAYRIERRQEFGRIKTIEVDCEKKRVREEYQIMLDEQKKLEDAKTAKKREKRLSKKKVKDSNKKLKEKEPEQSDQKVDDDE